MAMLRLFRFYVLYVVYLQLSLSIVTVTGNQTAQIKILTDSLTDHNILDQQVFSETLAIESSELSTTSKYVKILQLIGKFSNSCNKKEAQGILKQMDGFSQEGVDTINSGAEERHNKDEEKLSAAVVKEDWVGVYHCPHVGTDSDMAECHGLLEKVRQAMMFGASAIIILALNPKIIKEVDINIFTIPVVIIDEVSNITALLAALATEVKLKIELTGEASPFNLEKVTLWSTCWRSRPGSGVVCFYDQKFSSTDVWKLWKYFYLALSVLLMLLIFKAHTDEQEADRHRPKHDRSSLVSLAISSMTCRRYQPSRTSSSHCDHDNDVCAICLDVFQYKQRIRTLPCVHEFHVHCVDKWLLHRLTCPLCKRSIINNTIEE